MKARTAAAVLALSLGLAGCGSTDPAWRDAAYRFGECGKGVQPMLREPKDDSEKALQEAFGIAVDECLKAKVK